MYVQHVEMSGVAEEGVFLQCHGQSEGYCQKERIKINDYKKP